MVMQSDPVREWRDQYARRYLQLDFEPLPSTPFHASMKPIFPELRIVRAAFSPGFLFRDDDLIRDGDDRVGFVVAQSGQITARHLGREIRLARGDATLMLMGETGGIGWREDTVLFDMLIPPAAWEARNARPKDGLMQRLSGKSDAMRLLHGYIRSLERTGLTALDNHHEIVRGHIIDLIVLATTTRCPIGDSNTSAVVAGRLSMALDYIASHFSDPELSLAKAARRLQISPRYLQQLLERSETSFVAHVNELRLKHAFMLLTTQNLSDVRVCEVALEAGFSDISYFNKLFRSRFGDTPKGVRKKSLTSKPLSEPQIRNHS